MTARRIRRSEDYFTLRGERYPFHRIWDGPSFARLENVTEEVQMWTLHAGQRVEVRPGDIPVISRQVFGDATAGAHIGIAAVPPSPALAAPEPEVRFVTVADPETEAENEALRKEVDRLKAELDAARAVPTEETAVSDELAQRMRPGETAQQTASRILPEIRIRQDELTQRLHLGRATPQERSEHTTLSELLIELARLGDAQ